MREPSLLSPEEQEKIRIALRQWLRDMRHSITCDINRYRSNARRRRKLRQKCSGR